LAPLELAVLGVERVTVGIPGGCRRPESVVVRRVREQDLVERGPMGVTVGTGIIADFGPGHLASSLLHP
jgi:hypothetical protein